IQGNPAQAGGILSPHNGGSKGCPTPTGWCARPRRAFTNLMPACEFGGLAMKETTNERPRCHGVADGCPPYTDRPQTQGRAGFVGRPEHPARRHVCSVSEDEELSLARLGAAFSRLSSPAG